MMKKKKKKKKNDVITKCKYKIFIFLRFIEV